MWNCFSYQGFCLSVKELDAMFITYRSIEMQISFSTPNGFEGRFISFDSKFLGNVDFWMRKSYILQSERVQINNLGLKIILELSQVER